MVTGWGIAVALELAVLHGGICWIVSRKLLAQSRMAVIYGICVAAGVAVFGPFYEMIGDSHPWDGALFVSAMIALFSLFIARP